MTLTEFLTARLDEDEAAAKACECAPSPAATWHVVPVPERSYNLLVSDDDGHVVIHGGGLVDDEDAAHIARHDPARVLREVEADRALLAKYEIAKALLPGKYKLGYCEAIEEVLAIRAARFSDHPDYAAWDSDREPAGG